MSLINIERTIELDVYDHDTTPSVIKAIQLDEGTRAVYAVIQNSRQDYDIGQNAEVKLTVLRPDKTRVQITGQTFGYSGTDGTMYGAKAELSDVALAVKGNLKAQFKITSGEQELRTEIFTISNGEALDAGDGDWAGDLDGHNLDEMAESIETLQTDMVAVNEDVSDLKEDLTQKVSIEQGVAHVGEALIIGADGKVIPGEAGVSVDPTLTFEGKAADAKAAGDAIVAVNEKLNNFATGSIVEYQQLNLLDNTTFTVGYLSNQNGQINTGQTAYQTSDYIPVNDVWYNIYNVARYCVYDENKQYITNRYGDSTYPYRPKSSENHTYIRVSVLNEKIDNAMVCELEHYYPNEDSVVSEHPTKLNAAGDNFASKLISDVANNDSSHFANGMNLFDINGGYLYALGQAQVAIDANTGDIFDAAKRIIALENNNRHFNGATIPSNGSIGSTYYIPVQAGKYMFTNYSYWKSAAYDSDKKYIQSVPACSYAFTGYLIPEGVSYVRLNFKAQTDHIDSIDTIALHSLEEAKNIMVWQEDEAVCTRPATTLQNQIDGSFVSPNYLDKVAPNMVDSDFLSAMKCMTIREINRREHAWRFGNFNAYIGSGTKGYHLIRKMLMDNGVDFCGFEEMSNRATDIGTYLKSWQFADGFVSPKNESGNGINALSLVSRFEVQTWNTYTMTTVTSNKDCINAKIRLPRYMDVYNPFRILSMYVIHPMVGANQQNLANELLSIIANDDSDYIVITSDTNSFGDTEESKVFWRVLEAGGFRPTIPITTKTVTQDNLSGESDAYPEKPWRHHSIDQIFISSNIDCVSYNVINTKDEYIGFYKNNTTTDGEYALSDHDFVYADLVFKDEVRQ